MVTAEEIRKMQDKIHKTIDDEVDEIISLIKNHIKVSTSRSLTIGFKLMHKTKVLAKLKELGFGVEDNSTYIESYDMSDLKDYWIYNYKISW